MKMVMLLASFSLQKNLLTTQRALFAKKILVGLFLLILCATHLKLDLYGMKNSLLLRKTMINAISNSWLYIMLAVVYQNPLASFNT